MKMNKIESTLLNHLSLEEFSLIKKIRREYLREKIKDNIQHWRENADYLWGKDPNKHYIDHSHRHAESLMKVTARFLYEYDNFLQLNDLELYCLIASIWLHDIGMSPSHKEETLDPLYVRKMHSLLSLERIKQESKKLIRLEEEIKYIVAEICLFHSSKTALTESQLVKLKGSLIWDDVPRSTYDIRVPYFNDVVYIRPRLLAAILRLCDACDLGGRRISDIEIKEESIHKNLYKSWYRSEKISEKALEKDFKEVWKHYNLHKLVKDVYFKGPYILIEPRPAFSTEEKNMLKRGIDELLTHDIESTVEVLKEFGVYIEDVKILSPSEIDKIKNEYSLRFKDQSTIVENMPASLSFELKKQPFYIAHLSPPPVPNFINREKEIRQIKDFLYSDKKILQIHGPGGYGKTALVSKIIEDIKKEKSFDHVIYLSNFESNTISLEKILFALLNHIEDYSTEEIIKETGQSLENKLNLIFMALARKKFIVVLDHFEYFINKEGDITDEATKRFLNYFLRCEGDDKIIIVTRRKFFLESDYFFNLTQELKISGGLSEKHGIEYLKKEGKRVGLQKEDEDILRRAVQLTQGIPKILNSIISILMRNPTLKIKDIIDNRRLFSEKILKNFMNKEFSYLEDKEKEILEWLTIMDRPVTEKELSSLSGIEVDKYLSSLVKDSFIEFDISQKLFYISPVIKEYINEILPIEKKIILHKKIIEFLKKNTKPSDEWKNFEDVEPMLQIFYHRVQIEEYEEACRILNQIDFDYLFWWGYGGLILQSRQKIHKYLKDPELISLNLRSIGNVYLSFGDLEKALHYYSKALEYAHSNGLKHCEGPALSNIGYTYYLKGDIEKAENFIQKALKLAEITENKKGKANRLRLLGEIYLKKGMLEKAEDFFSKSLSLASELNMLKDIGRSYMELGLCFEKEGKISKATSFYLKSLMIAKQENDMRYIGLNLLRLGNVLLLEGKIQQAQEYLMKSIDIFKKINYKTGLVESYQSLGDLYYWIDEVEKGFENYVEALNIAKNIKDIYMECKLLTKIALVNRYSGSWEVALNKYKEALKLAENKNYTDLEELILGKMGELYYLTGQYIKSEKYIKKALEISKQRKDFSNRSEWLRILGDLYRDSLKYTEAKQCYKKSIEIANKIKNNYQLVDCLGMCGILLMNEGNLEEAEKHIKEAMKLSLQIGDKWSQEYWVGWFGILYLKKSEEATFLKFLDEALRLADMLNVKQHKIIWYNKLGEYFLNKKQFEKAEEYISNSLDLAEEIGYTYYVSLNYYLLSEIMRIKGELEKAQLLYEKGKDLSERIECEYLKQIFKKSIFQEGKREK